MGEKIYPYKQYMIEEGVAPDSEQFNYYFMVTEEGKKVAHFVVHVEGSVLAEAEVFEKGCRGVIEDQYVVKHRPEWQRWVHERIDKGYLQDMLLLIDEHQAREVDMKKELKRKAGV